MWLDTYTTIYSDLQLILGLYDNSPREYCENKTLAKERRLQHRVIRKSIEQGM